MKHGTIKAGLNLNNTPFDKVKTEMDQIANDHKSEIEDKIKEILKRNYPNIDFNDTNSLAELVTRENLSIQVSDSKVDFEPDFLGDTTTVRATSVIKIFKELI